MKGETMAKKATKKAAVKAEPPESKPEPAFTARFGTQTASAAAISKAND